MKKFFIVVILLITAAAWSDTSTARRNLAMVMGNVKTYYPGTTKFLPSMNPMAVKIMPFSSYTFNFSGTTRDSTMGFLVASDSVTTFSIIFYNEIGQCAGTQRSTNGWTWFTFTNGNDSRYSIVLRNDTAQEKIFAIQNFYIDNNQRND